MENQIRPVILFSTLHRHVWLSEYREMLAQPSTENSDRAHSISQVWFASFVSIVPFLGGA